MKRTFLCIFIVIFACRATSQTVNTAQQLKLQGLRASGGHGSFLAANYAPDGTLVLLYDQGDGIRILRSDASGSSILAQAHVGSTGDSAVAMALDATGNIYITGTTASGALSGTSGAAFSSRADNSTNSFLAKYDLNLDLIFLTFLGSGRTAASSVSATADAVFVTGTTFNAAFPVTQSGIQQAPALNSSQNGFVERFTTDGSTLVYATYLTGANGSTTPTAIVSDAADNAYITGSTSASGYPTLNALQPEILGATSGFLTQLTPAGDGFVYSTFLAGTGMSSMALDATNHSLLITGNISLGQFPVSTVAMPLVDVGYQALLRVPLNGQSLGSSVVLGPGSQSYVSAGPNGDAWISGSLTTTLLPGAVPPDYNSGDSFLLHLTSSDTFDQTLRFGGAPVSNPGYASMSSTFAAPAVAGASIVMPGTMQTNVSASLLSTQRFYLPQIQTPNAGLLPNTLRDALPSPVNCNSQCLGSAALLGIVSTASSAPALGLSIDDMPNLTLRNMGSATATGLAITASGFSVASNCATTLAPSSQCSIALTGPGPGSITVSSSNAAAATAALGTNALQPNAIALSASELDFGVTTAAAPTRQTITVTNLSASSQTFSSTRDGGTNSAAIFAESDSDCAQASAPNLHMLEANGSCHITFSLTASSAAANDGPVRASWKIGARDVVFTGFSQASALSLSATEVDFGTHFAVNGSVSGINLPRYLYLSNNSAAAIAHSTVALPAGSAFTVTDGCPSVLQAHSVCQMKLLYSPATSPSQDATKLTLDSGLSVLLTGKTLPPASVTGSSTNPSLSVSTTAVTFTTPVIVTGISSTTQSVTLHNNGVSAFALSTSLSGDFVLTNGCPAQLAGGASCTLLVGFAPSQPGTRLGLLSLIAGNGFAPTYVSLNGTATPVLPANNGLLDLGETLVGEPAVQWYKVQQPLPSLTVSSNSSAFSLALVQDTGSGHSALPASNFASAVTAACGNCWLGVQFLSQTAGLQAGTLSLSSTTGGSAYTLTLTGTALPVQGLVLSPLTQDFDTVNVSSASEPFTFTLANLLAGAASVGVQSISTSGDFVLTTNATGGASCAGALAATASCFVQVAFSPTATGQRTGLLNIVTSQGTVHSTLTGYGAPDPGVAVSPIKLDFENTPGSNAIQQSVIVSNTGTSLLNIGVVTASDPSFTPVSGCATLTAGSLCSISVSFTPQMASATATLSIPVTMTVNGQTTTTLYSVALNGGYTTATSGLQILPAEVNFGATATDAAGGTRQFTLNNLSGKQLSVTLQMPHQFPLAATPTCTTLAPGSNCTFSVRFLPVTDGAITGSVYAQGISTDGLTSVEAITYMLGYGAGTGALEVDGLPIPYSPVSFGQVGSGQTTSHTLTLTNGGTGTLNIHRISSGIPFQTTNTCRDSLPSGASCTVTITYAPIYQIASSADSSAARSDSDSLIIESDAASSPDIVSLSGLAAPVLTSNPTNTVMLATFQLTQSSLTFANTQLGSSSAAQTIMMTNTGTTTLHIGSVVAPTDFSANTTCTTLFAGASCQITVQFVPTSVSASALRSGALHILSDAGTSLEFVSLIGTSSAAPLTLNPTTLNFGSVNIGSTGTLSLSVTNTTAAPITFFGYTATSNYSVSAGSCPAMGSQLAAGSSCSVSVSFVPSAIGVLTGTLTLTTDATTSPLTIALLGTGVPSVAPTPAFALTVNGGTSATLTVASGSPAVYNLLLTPINGFTGTVALTCTPIVAATYASCSLLSPTLTLNGSALTSTATINTITTAAVRTGAGLALLLLGPALFWRRRSGRGVAAIVMLATIGALTLGCGSSSRAPVTSNIQRTPPGTYQYQVTASSTTGTVVSSTVTLHLTVQ
jgi:hypothetical protein